MNAEPGVVQLGHSEMQHGSGSPTNGVPGGISDLRKYSCRQQSSSHFERIEVIRTVAKGPSSFAAVAWRLPEKRTRVKGGTGGRGGVRFCGNQTPAGPTAKSFSHHMSGTFSSSGRMKSKLFMEKKQPSAVWH